MDRNKNITICSNGELELKISVDDETIWLTQKQISELFDKDVRAINEHIKTIYKEEELYQNSTIRNFRIVQKEGKYQNLKFTIITNPASKVANSGSEANFPQKQLNLDIEKYNSQYDNLTIKNSNKFYDRFLIIDNKDIYHLGASLKDLGKKTFAFSRLNIDLIEFLGKIK